MIVWAFFLQNCWWADANAQKLLLKMAKSWKIGLNFANGSSPNCMTLQKKSDQKWLVLHEAPNARNNLMWVPWDPKMRLNVRGREIWKWWHGEGWLMGECWRWGGWWTRMVGRSWWPCGGIRICYNSMYSRQSKIDQALGVTGLCKMEQRPAQPTSTSTFSITNFKQECSPFWSPLGHTNGRPKVWIWTVFSLICLGLHAGPILLHQT